MDVNKRCFYHQQHKNGSLLIKRMQIQQTKSTFLASSWACSLVKFTKNREVRIIFFEAHADDKRIFFFFLL